MVRKDGAEARKERIAKIAANTQAALYLNKDLGYISLKKTVAKHELETGLTREKIMEYLALLVEDILVGVPGAGSDSWRIWIVRINVNISF